MSEVKLSQQQVDHLIEKWSQLTAGEEEERPRLPIEALTGEAINVAQLFSKNWETRHVNGQVRHGLDSTVSTGNLNAETGSEIRELSSCVRECQADYDTLVKRATNVPIEKAEAMLGELRGALSFLLEDGSHDEGDEQLSQLRGVHSDPESMLSLAMAIEGYAELAEIYKAELAQLPRFPLEIIDDALQVARDLRIRSAERDSGELVSKQREILSLRNRLIAALVDRMTAVRRAVRYVFSAEPEIVRQAASSYERKKRAAAARSRAASETNHISGHEPTLDMPTPATA